jgi:CMP-N,N'-diacetyllegionaminic acid synthase
MNRLCTICARGGSKGVRNKNIRDLNGLPLIVHSLNHARDAELFDCIAVSSDSDDILDVAKHWGCELLIKRPIELANDVAPKVDAIRHCVREVIRITGCEFETLVDLDATSPLRCVQDIRAVVELLETTNAHNVVTVMPSRRSPYFNILEVSEAGEIALSKTAKNPIFRRQDSPKCYDMNASVYAWRASALFNDLDLVNASTLMHVMPEVRSIDIDNELDFEFVEFLMQRS